MKKILLFIILFVALIPLSNAYTVHNIEISYQNFLLSSNLYFMLHMAALTLLGLLIIKDSILAVIYARKKRRQQVARQNLEFGTENILISDYKAAYNVLSSIPQETFIYTLLRIFAMGMYGYLQDALDCIAATQKKYPARHTTLTILKAKLYMAHNEEHKAIIVLYSLNYKKEPLVLKFLVEALVQAQKWQNIIELEAYINRYNIFDELKTQQLLALAHQKLLASFKGKNFSNITQVFMDFSYAMQTHPKVLSAYLRVTHKYIHKPLINKLVMIALESQWDLELLSLYRNINIDNPRLQLRACEKFIALHPNCAALYLLLASFALRCALYGKAKEYLLQCLKLEPHNVVANLQLKLLVSKIQGDSTLSYDVSELQAIFPELIEPSIA